MLKAKTRLSGWVYVDIRDRDLSSVVYDMQKAVAKKLNYRRVIRLPGLGSLNFWNGHR